MDYFCSDCGKKENVSTHTARCACGGLWTLAFTPPKFDVSLLDTSVRGVFRYRAFLPIGEDAWRKVTLGEGGTPIVHLDADVMLKMDYFMPTLSFKDRGAAVLVTHMKEVGVSRAVQDSSGNAGNAVAAYCARAGIACEIYVPEGTSPNKINMIRAYGANCVIVPGCRDDCAQACRARVFNEGVFYASHVFNPFFFEGTKTYLYEVYEELGRLPENLFVPLGNGTLLLGIFRALEHLQASGCLPAMPRVFAVQSERCAPFYEAWRSGSAALTPVRAQTTLAEGIAIGAPARGREIMDVMRRYNVTVLLAPEKGILAARDTLAHKGVFIEHTSAATYAAYVDYVQKHGPLRDCLIPACGAGLKSEH